MTAVDGLRKWNVARSAGMRRAIVMAQLFLYARHCYITYGSLFLSAGENYGPHHKKVKKDAYV